MAYKENIKNRLIKLWLSTVKRYRFIHGQHYYVAKRKDINFLLDRKNKVDRHVDGLGMYEGKQIDTLIKLIRQSKADVFLDIGAHWGLYSLVVVKQLPELEIHAFEPDPINRYQLYANLFLNRIESIQVHDYGLSDHDGEVRFSRASDVNRGMSQIDPNGNSSIQVRKLDSCFNWQNKTIAIKIDVEHAEFLTLAGMKNLLQNNRCILQIECFGDDAKVRLAQVLGPHYKHIKSLGFMDADQYFCHVDF